MFKKFKVWGCFLEIACYCLNIDANFGHFQKLCFMHFDKQSRRDEVFFIKNTSQFNRQSLFHVSYAACYKDFADFQIDFFIKTDSFPLRPLDCWRSSRDRQQQNVDFDYRDMHWSNSDNSSCVFDSSDDNVELVKRL